MKLREEASIILQATIGEEWEPTMQRLDKLGVFSNQRVIKDLVIMLCKRLEKLEEEVRDVTPRSESEK